MPRAAPASTRQSREMGRSSTAKGTCSISRMNDRQSLNAFLMSPQISRSRKTLNRRHTEGCNDSIAGRARSAIINAQLETGACALMERQQQRLAAPRTRRSQLVRYLRFFWHAVAPNCASRSAPNCVYSVLQGCFAISLIEPQKTAGQLPQIISSVTHRKSAGSPEHVGSLPPTVYPTGVAWLTRRLNRRI